MLLTSPLLLVPLQHMHVALTVRLMVVPEFLVFLVCTALLDETVEMELKEIEEKRGEERKGRRETLEESVRRAKRARRVWSVPKETVGKWGHEG